MTETLRIEKLIHGGDGMGRLSDGRVVFASNVVPGDAITGEPLQVQRLWRLPAYRLTDASPDRQAPQCPESASTQGPICDGCDWQHLTTEAQRHWKTEIVRESFQRVGKIADAPVQPIRSDADWGYRHTVTWHVAAHNGQAQLAYHARSSNTPVVFDACRSLCEALQHAAMVLNAHPAILQACKAIKARANSQGDVLIGLEFFGNESPTLDVSSLLTAPIVGISQLTPEVTLLAGEDTLVDTFNGKPFVFGLHHFMQAHPGVVNAMLAWLQTELAHDLTKATTILDAYCGIGVFGLALLQPHQQLIGVEGHKPSLEMAKTSAHRQNSSLRCNWYPKSVEAFTGIAQKPVDLAICDPPRNGMKPSVVAWLAHHVQHTIVYVSCDSATLARDAKQLTDKGWQLAAVQPWDMFPQTHHVETVAIFRKGQ